MNEYSGEVSAVVRMSVIVDEGSDQAGMSREGMRRFALETLEDVLRVKSEHLSRVCPVHWYFMGADLVTDIEAANPVVLADGFDDKTARWNKLKAAADTLGLNDRQAMKFIALGMTLQGDLGVLDDDVGAAAWTVTRADKVGVA